MGQRPNLRNGKSGAAIAMGLFLLSMVSISAALRWAYPGGSQRLVQTLADYKFRDDSLEENPPTRQALPMLKDWNFVEDLGIEIAQFETVFWEPADTTSLREWLSASEAVQGGDVLEIGTGSGLIAIACLLHGAARVVATDINPNAIANAGYNAQHLRLEQRLETRLVEADNPGPFAVIQQGEKFDLIISNPPWEDAEVNEVAAHALYDPNFALLDGLLEHSAAHLREHGSLLLAYGAKQAIERILLRGPELGWQITQADGRQLSELPEVFVPGMLLVLTPQTETGQQEGSGAD